MTRTHIIDTQSFSLFSFAPVDIIEVTGRMGLPSYVRF